MNPDERQMQINDALLTHATAIMNELGLESVRILGTFSENVCGYYCDAEVGSRFANKASVVNAFEEEIGVQVSGPVNYTIEQGEGGLD